MICFLQSLKQQFPPNQNLLLIVQTAQPLKWKTTALETTSFQKKTISKQHLCSFLLLETVKFISKTLPIQTQLSLDFQLWNWPKYPHEQSALNALKQNFLLVQLRMIEGTEKVISPSCVKQLCRVTRHRSKADVRSNRKKRSILTAQKARNEWSSFCQDMPLNSQLWFLYLPA